MEIIFYSTHCPRCRVLEAKLKEKKVQYSEINSEDEIIALGLKSIPTLKVNGENLLYLDAIKWVNSLEA